jgi:hypothetical protein
MYQILKKSDQNMAARRERASIVELLALRLFVSFPTTW